MSNIVNYIVTIYPCRMYSRQFLHFFGELKDVFDFHKMKPNTEPVLFIYGMTLLLPQSGNRSRGQRYSIQNLEVDSLH